MTTTHEDRIQLDAERDARRSNRRPEELGSTCQGEFVKGPILSFCCDALSAGAIWRVKGIRTGTCSKCYESSTFREVIKS